MKRNTRENEWDPTSVSMVVHSAPVPPPNAPSSVSVSMATAAPQAPELHDFGDYQTPQHLQVCAWLSWSLSLALSLLEMISKAY